jgi:hypothetical protein
MKLGQAVRRSVFREVPMAQRGYRYVKPRQRICGRRRAPAKFVWLLAKPGTRMQQGVVTMREAVQQGRIAA